MNMHCYCLTVDLPTNPKNLWHPTVNFWHPPAGCSNRGVSKLQGDASYLPNFDRGCRHPPSPPLKPPLLSISLFPKDEHDEEKEHPDIEHTAPQHRQYLGNTFGGCNRKYTGRE